MGVLSMLLNMFRGYGFDFFEFFAYVIASLVIIMLILPLHEFAHAFVADKLGDPTARYMRRRTLNPFAHIDWLGAASIIFLGFGWAKPVPVNMRNFNKPKIGMAIVALAGPVSNLIAAFVGMGLMHSVAAVYPFINSEIVNQILLFVMYVLSFFSSVNVTLAVFNLIPIPPLDGSRLLAAFLPDRIYYRIMQYERYFSILLWIVILSGLFDPILVNGSGYILTLYSNFFKFVFGLFL